MPNDPQLAISLDWRLQSDLITTLVNGTDVSAVAASLQPPWADILAVTTAHRDVVVGGGRIYGLDGEDWLYAGAGRDILFGRWEADLLSGGADADALFGGDG